MIQRSKDLAWLKQWRGHKVIKIITGVRRCGKSTLLLQYREELTRIGTPESNILFLNFENYMHVQLRQPGALHQYVLDYFNGRESDCHLLLDEIQIVEQWEDVINSLHLDKRLDIVLTGSNANLLASELATRLSGRYIQQMLLPFSLAEARELIPDLTLNDYFRFGGFPGVLQLSDEQQKLNLLDDLTDSILFKDILLRGNVANPITLQNLSRFLFDTVGNRSSVRKITHTLNSLSGEKTRQETIAKYITYLEEAFLLYAVERFDLRGRAILSREPKYYAIDPGIRTVLTSSSNRNLGSVLENLVFLELRRLDYRVFVGQQGDLEVDFIAEKGSHRIYIQVAMTILDEQTAAREFKPLQMIDDNYPKFVLTLDPFDMSRDGIIHGSAEEFLLGKLKF
ncbi:MAG: ATP-binding protein [Eubacteriales bacterium]|nr:ATP-binding protein [Eubacteriales bacterium]